MSRNRFPTSLRLFYTILLAVAAFGAPATPSGTTLGSSPSPSVQGQAVTLTATVTTGATGKVTFYDGSTVLGIGLLTGAQAKFTTSLLPSGTHSLHARYSGDSAYLPSDSPSLPQTVSAVPANGVLPSTNSAGGTSYAVADFNSDRKPDLAYLDSQNHVNVLLGNGDGTFQPPVSSPAGVLVSGIPHLAVGDFNGDGIPDIVLADQFRFVNVLLGNGNGTFRAPVSYPAGQNPGWITVSDFNRDGNADLAVVGNVVSILLGNGDGTFQPPSPWPGQFMAPVADFNGDGKPDLAVGGGIIDILLGNGDGTFRPPVPIMDSTFSDNLVVGDFNGDGKADLAAGQNGDFNLAIFLGNGDGTFRKSAKYTVPSYILAAADFNGDGKPDLMVMGASNVPVVLIGKGDGTFQFPVDYGSTAIGGGLSVTGDFNGDGRTDLASLGGFPSYGTAVLLGSATPDLTIAMTRSGSFAPGTIGEAYTITVGNLPFAPTTGPVTVTDTLSPGLTPASIGGAGWNCGLAPLVCTRADVLAPGAAYPPITLIVSVAANVPGTIRNTAIVSGSDSNPANNTASDTLVIRGGSILLFSSPNPSTLGQPVQLVATVTPGATGLVTFFDGLTPLGASPVAGGQAVLTTRLLGGGARWLQATFSPDATSLYAAAISARLPENVVVSPTNQFQTAVNYALPGRMGYLATGDFNGDGKGDLAVGGGSLVGVMLGNGDGTFRPPIVSTAGVVIGTLLALDLNRDGKTDIVTTSQVTTSGTASINVLLGNGDGTFQALVPYAIQGGVVRIAAADFNGDGNVDVAFLSATGTTWGVLFGRSDGTFAPPVQFQLNASAFGLAVGDLNGDGKADLLMPTQPSGLTVIFGNGDGTFQPPADSSVEGFQFGINLAIGDLNGDGKIDAVLSSGNGVTVLLGNGDGTFRNAGTFYAGAYPYSLSIGDLNGDGKADLAIADINGFKVRVLFGKGDGTFRPPLVLAAGDQPTSVVFGDFNGDGKMDLASGNQQTPSVSVFLGAFSTRIDLTVWRPSNGTWYVNPAAKPPFAQPWGSAGDIPLAADFDGDGIPDIAVWNPLHGIWSVIPSSDPGHPTNTQWGFPSDIPVPGDFDGDGRADPIVWRPSEGNWYWLSSRLGGGNVRQWGFPNDIPVSADFDGDGRADLAVWRPSEGTWYVILSASQLVVVRQWGLQGDIPVAADFDGDGKADFAVWRPSTGTWYVIPSSNPSAPRIVQWGLPGDVPVPRDYDLDGKTDFAVWRPSNGTWYILPSSAPSAPVIVQWGLPGDQNPGTGTTFPDFQPKLP